jgi:dienelactone hydrolase
VTVSEETRDTPDGWTLALTHFIPDQETPPVLILAHRYGGDRAYWRDAAHRLAQHGYLVTTFDLRGHNDSRRHADASRDYRAFKEADWQEALQDLSTAHVAAEEAGGDTSAIAVGGEGIGAALALYYALAEPAVQAVLLFSPALNDHGIDTLAGMRRLRETPSLIMAGEADTAAARAATALHDAAPVFSELRMWPTGALGADVLYQTSDAFDQLLQWLNTTYRDARNSEN